MSLSGFARDIIAKVLGFGTSNKSSNYVTYQIKLDDTRGEDTIMSSSFKFKKPIPESVLEEKIPEFVNILNEYLVAEKLGVINAVLKQAGLSPKALGTSNIESGTKPIGLSDVTEEVGELGLNSIRAKSGRFISLENFKGLISVLAKGYMLEHMTSGGPQLHNRTGRFINTTEIQYVVVTRGGISGRNKIRIVYDYMKYPYETFDPAGPNSRGLASDDRNPRRIIGDAITKAVDDIVNLNLYNLEIIQL